MDTEAIASEIVSIRGRLRELDESVEAGSDDERKELQERMHHLQDVLAGHGTGKGNDSPGQSDQMQYVPPA
jgi:hypothetical protein